MNFHCILHVTKINFTSSYNIVIKINTHILNRKRKKKLLKKENLVKKEKLLKQKIKRYDYNTCSIIDINPTYNVNKKQINSNEKKII